MGIPTKLSESYVGQLVERVAELEAENARLREIVDELAGMAAPELWKEADALRAAAAEALKESPNATKD